MNSADAIFSLTLPTGGKQLTLPFRDEVLHMPILRASDDGTRAEELQGSVASKRLRSLGQQMGYREPVTWYWLRRLVLNAVDGLTTYRLR